MKNLIEFVNEGSQNTKYMNKSQLYLLSIPFEMYKEYNQYKEDFSNTSDDEYQDLQDMQTYFNNIIDDDRVKVMYKKMAPSIQRGISLVCKICLKHEEDFSKLDISLLKNILSEVEDEKS